MKTLAKERERRYQSAAELARDIRHYLAGEPIEAKRDSTWYVLRKTLRRFKAIAATIAAITAAVPRSGCLRIKTSGNRRRRKGKV
jgi:hypothetical protein